MAKTKKKVKAKRAPKREQKKIKVGGNHHTVSDLKKIAQQHHRRKESHQRMYKFGFWIFFALTLFSVVFSVWAVTSIYANFQVVTKILDESFERTNLVLDITSSKITSCEQNFKDCQEALMIEELEHVAGAADEG